MKTRFKLATVSLLFVAIVGCRSNPVNRLLGLDHNSNSDSPTIQSSPPGTSNPPTPYSARLRLFVAKPEFQSGETVNFGIKNESPVPIRIQEGPSSFQIIGPDNKPVIRILPLLIKTVTLAPGESVIESWDQKSITGQVPPGKYAVQSKLADPKQVPFTILPPVPVPPPPPLSKVHVASIEIIRGGAIGIPPGDPSTPPVIKETVLPLPNAAYTITGADGIRIHRKTDAQGNDEPQLRQGTWTFSYDLISQGFTQEESPLPPVTITLPSPSSAEPEVKVGFVLNVP